MRLRRDFLRSIEAGIIGLFFIQGIRFLYSTLYAHLSSADLVRRVADTSRLVELPGYVTPETVERELLATGIAILAPLVALFFARTRWSIPLAVALCAVGRTMALQQPDSAAVAAALVVGAGLLYMVLIIIYRPNQFPVMFLVGIALDQLIRASGNTFDPTWNPAYEIGFLGFEMRADDLFLRLMIGVLIIAGSTTLVELEVARLTPPENQERQGMLTGWGSMALGAFIFIQLTLLGLPNVIARWAEVSYREAVPWLLLATSLPLVPSIRNQARVFLGAFDGVWRGWLWALLLGLLMILGNRFEGTMALFVLVFAQFVSGLTLWWMIKLRDRDTNLPNPTPILTLMVLVIFGVLSVGDYFTYDYAFVRDFDAPFDALGSVLRSFRGLGLVVFLVAALVSCMPMILERRVIPWRRGRIIESYMAIAILVALSLNSISMTTPPTIQPPADINCLRVGTLNIHSGYTLLFDNNLERITDAIQNRPNGTELSIDILLLQEVDTGRLSSFGVDQAEWLARELGMHATYFPQNEALNGLAVLSRIPILNATGQLLSSDGAQGAVLHVELNFDEQPFHIYNVWLGFQTLDETGIPIPHDLQDQTRQTRELEQLIVRNHSPAFNERIVLGGTFNYDRDTLNYNFWQNDTVFEDPFRNRAIEQVQTVFLVDGTSARFDYLWLMNLEEYGVTVDLDVVVSDHRLAMVGVNRTSEQNCPA